MRRAQHIRVSEAVQDIAWTDFSMAHEKLIGVIYVFLTSNKRGDQTIFEKAVHLIQQQPLRNDSVGKNNQRCQDHNMNEDVNFERTVHINPL